MNKYELLAVLPGTLTDDEAATKAEEIKEMVNVENGSEITLAAMGKNRLAYPIKQIRYGYFYTITFMAEARAIVELQKKLALLRDVLRTLISHFRVEFSASQKAAFTSTGGPAANSAKAPWPSPAKVTRMPQAVIEKKVSDKPAIAPATSVAERPIAQVDLDKISKKLDDLIEGDIIPE